MGQIQHHLTDPLLIGYAAGSLPEAFSLVVATHISLCDDCRARLGEFETVGGCLLDDCAPRPLAPGAFQATLHRIATHADDTPPAPAPAPPDTPFPAPLRAYAGPDVAAVRWRAMGGGLRQARLNTAPGASLRLLHIPAGTRLPDHGHRGLEMTLVLQGAFSDEDGRFARGDIEIANEAVHHTPVAEQGEDCICLAATDAPLKFNGLVQRIAQPFLGI
ncbi:ChrR family anti-sigma-E factor [Oceaniglobus trochenteri]|uniref:ChrR family anti-sigma-E factor n=1 Tax=Oceaniglobus trochenteri TaxID=2763260 RepID=UPI001CFFA705|nr:ChrR family anti-sigma-E factor [Oceaniglobus trochenteri]